MRGGVYDGRHEWQMFEARKWHSIHWSHLVLGMGRKNIEIKGNIKQGNQSRNSILMRYTGWRTTLRANRI